MFHGFTGKTQTYIIIYVYILIYIYMRTGMETKDGPFTRFLFLERTEVRNEQYMPKSCSWSSGKVRSVEILHRFTHVCFTFSPTRFLYKYVSQGKATFSTIAALRRKTQGGFGAQAAPDACAHADISRFNNYFLESYPACCLSWMGARGYTI